LKRDGWVTLLSTLGQKAKRPVRSIEELDMSEKSDNACIEFHTIIDDADRRITDLNANRFGVGENAKDGRCAPTSLSRLAGDIGGPLRMLSNRP
jgi:hypothetical protein